jgi:AraC-like DNA-binding protein
MDNDIAYKITQPCKPLADFVDSFWCLHNQSEKDKETIGLPDGRIDLMLFQSAQEPFRIVLLGLGTSHTPANIPANTLMFVISFKLLAVEYILREPIADLVNSGKYLANDFWNFNADDLRDFEAFCEKASAKIKSILTTEIDERKRKLFELISATNGANTVKSLSDKVCWSSRQINRYFNQQFGLSLKTHCNILRFRAALEHIAEGQLFPSGNFFDKTHFIKEVKKFSGAIPKELSQNKNDRFILLSALSKQ